MRAHVFPNEQALQLALTSGLVPKDVQSAPAEYARWPDGSVVVRPARPLGREALEALTRSGVKSPPAVEGELTPAQCWAEVLATRREREDSQPLSSVLFALPGEGKSLLELCGEM